MIHMKHGNISVLCRNIKGNKINIFPSGHVFLLQMSCTPRQYTFVCKYLFTSANKIKFFSAHYIKKHLTFLLDAVMKLG